MSEQRLPIILTPGDIRNHAGTAPLLLVDLGDAEAYEQGHIPGAVHLPFPTLIRQDPPAMGLLPDEASLSQTLSSIGLTPKTHVVAYDHDGGGRASRLVWTLHALGHDACSMLDGGIAAWAAAQLPLEQTPVTPTPSNYQARIQRPEVMADKEFLLEHLNDDDVLVVDSRSPAEYDGSDRRAARGGHIPGAVNLNWIETKDPERQGRLLSDAELRARLTALGITPERDIVTHCQTHHRSSHTYVVLKHLGYPRVRGYAGSWSEWGNDPDVPIES